MVQMNWLLLWLTNYSLEAKNWNVPLVVVLCWRDLDEQDLMEFIW
jgi:hypothetical protein